VDADTIQLVDSTEAAHATREDLTLNVLLETLRDVLHDPLDAAHLGGIELVHLENAQSPHGDAIPAIASARRERGGFTGSRQPLPMGPA
jgi:hypothetical protein